MTAPAKEAELYLVAWRGDAARNILYSCCHILKQRDVYIYIYITMCSRMRQEVQKISMKDIEKSPQPCAIDE